MTSSQCGQTNNSVFVEHNAHFATIDKAFGLAVILKKQNLIYKQRSTISFFPLVNESSIRIK
jgi:hypothetical protein